MTKENNGKKLSEEETQSSCSSPLKPSSFPKNSTENEMVTESQDCQGRRQLSTVLYVSSSENSYDAKMQMLANFSTSKHNMRATSCLHDWGLSHRVLQEPSAKSVKVTASTTYGSRSSEEMMEFRTLSVTLLRFSMEASSLFFTSG